MEQKQSPSISSTNVRRMFEDAKHLEQQIRNAPNNPNNASLIKKSRQKLRDLYCGIIFIDYEYSVQKEVELSLWKSCFYKPADDFRAMCKKAHRNLNSEQKQGSRAKDELARVCANFKVFLEEASTFFNGLIAKFESTYKLNLQHPNFQDPNPLAQHAYISCHRCYIYLGDLMRYHRDLHHDPTQKNWTQATTFYQHAIRLYPESGHPHNQLAVMCTHKDFEFRTLYHYYRALFAKVPFPGTRENLTSLLERNRAKFQNAEAENKSVLETFLLCFVRLHGIAFTCKGEETFPVVLPKALHLFEKLIQHGTIKANLIWQLFIVNLSTLHNAINMDNSDQSIMSIRLSLTLLISFFANLLYQFLVLPDEKLRFYRNFYKPISLISSWLSMKSFFLSQPTDLAQRVLWAKLRELFAKVVTKILTEELPDENNIETNAPTSEDVDFQGFLPLQYLAEAHKINFSLAQLSGADSDQRRREKIIQFAFFACQTVWVGEETFIYFDRSTNSFTLQNPANKPQQLSPQQQQHHQQQQQPTESSDEDDDENVNNDPLFLVDNINFNGNEDDEEDEEELDDVVLYKPVFHDSKQESMQMPMKEQRTWDGQVNGNDWNSITPPSETSSHLHGTSPVLRFSNLHTIPPPLHSPKKTTQDLLHNLLGGPSLGAPINFGVHNPNSFFSSSEIGQQGVSNDGSGSARDIFSASNTMWNQSSFFNQFSCPLSSSFPTQVDELANQTAALDLDGDDDAPPGLFVNKDDDDDYDNSVLIGNNNLISRNINKNFLFLSGDQIRSDLNEPSSLSPISSLRNTG